MKKAALLLIAMFLNNSSMEKNDISIEIPTWNIDRGSTDESSTNLSNQ